MPDVFERNLPGLESPATRAFDAYASRSDTVDLTQPTRAIYTGSGGNLKVTLVGDANPVVFTAVPAGSFLPLRVARLWSGSTTVTDCLGLY